MSAIGAVCVEEMTADVSNSHPIRRHKVAITWQYKLLAHLTCLQNEALNSCQPFCPSGGPVGREVPTALIMIISDLAVIEH